MQKKKEKVDLVKFILKRNELQSKEFCSAGAQLSRRLYRAQHPTDIIALKCMDGRLNLAIMTNTPQGIVQPYRNIGGKFDLGWPFFGRLILDQVEYAVAKGRPVLILSTYHFSRGDHHRGCAGYGYDTKGAIAGAERMRVQLEKAFGGGSPVYPVLVGIETDQDALVFHGKNGKSFSVADMLAVSSDDLRAELVKTYPDMSAQMVEDLLPLVVGNQKHVQEIVHMQRPVIDLEHREQIIALGRGFDWLHLPNRALIIGPYDPRWENAVATAGSIIVGNMKAKRIREEEGALLLVSAPYRDVGAEQGVEVEKALYLAREGERVLREKVPNLMKKLRVLVGTVDLNTRAFNILKKA